MKINFNWKLIFFQFFFFLREEIEDIKRLKELVPADFLLNDEIEKLPVIGITKIATSRALTTMKGPGDSSNPEQSFGSFACAKVVSNYPLIPGRPFREGDPICDRYYLKMYENRIVIALADGCNWGERPRKAAKRASKRFIEIIDEYHDQIVSVRAAGPILLYAYSEAHKSIIRDFDEESAIPPGTTTLIGGILLQIQPKKGSKIQNIVTNPNESNEWAFVFATLGDCKFFRYCAHSKIISDLTIDNRNCLDSTDPGGRLGGSGPDLRNLNINYQIVNEGDYIFAVSDGIYDNFDPQHRGVSPREFNIPQDKWEDIPDTGLISLTKSKYILDEITKLILDEQGNTTPQRITLRLLEFCTNLTKTSRDFMEANPTQKLPGDFKLYPGKLDHATCVCIRVGRVTLSYKDWVTSSETTFDVIGDHPSSWKTPNLAAMRQSVIKKP